MALRHFKLNLGRLNFVFSDSTYSRSQGLLKHSRYVVNHRASSNNRGSDFPNAPTALHTNNSRSTRKSRTLGDPPALASEERLLSKIEATGSIDEVLGLVVLNPNMEKENLLAVADRIASFQKLPECRIESKELHNHPGFVAFCHKLRKKASSFGHVSELLTGLKVLSLCKVPGDSRVVQTLLHLIKEEINDLEVQHMPFLHYLLSKIPPSSLTKALHIALPLLVESRLGQLEPNDISTIATVFSYAVRQKVSANCINKLLELISSHPGPWEPSTALTFLWSTIKIKVSVDEAILAEAVQRILEENVVVMTSWSRKDAEYGLLSLSELFSTRKPFWYHEKLCDAVASKVVQETWGFNESSTVARALSKFAHVHPPFLDYFANLIVSRKNTATEPILYPFYLLSSFAMANYKPLNYQDMLEVVLESPALNSESINHPWYRLAVDCAVLGCYPHQLLDRIFRREFLEDFFKRGSSLDYLQLLLLHQSVENLSPNYAGARLPPSLVEKAKEIRLSHFAESPLALPLEVGLGGSQYVVHTVMTKQGHVADHAIVLRPGGYPVAITPESRHGTVLVEDIEVPKDGQLVLVLVQRAHCFASNVDKLRGFYALESQTLQSRGYAVLPVALHRWEQLLEHERIPYLMQQLRMIQGTVA